MINSITIIFIGIAISFEPPLRPGLLAARSANDNDDNNNNTTNDNNNNNE